MTERSENKSTLKAHLAVLFTNLFFSANYSLVKNISPSLVGPYALNVIRVAVSIILFWILWLFGKSKAGIQKQHWGRFILCALTGVAINQTLFIKGLTMTSTIHASLLMLATPIVVNILAMFTLKEGFNFFKAAGLALGVGGSLLLVLQKETGPHAPNYILGDILIVLNALAYSVYFIAVKPLMQTYGPVHVIRWVFSIGLIMIIPFGWQQTSSVHWDAFDPGSFIALASVIVTGTFLAYVFNAYGLQHLGAGITGSYIYTQPFFAVLIATVFVGEKFTWQKLIAALLIFAGVYLVSFRRKN